MLKLPYPFAKTIHIKKFDNMTNENNSAKENDNNERLEANEICLQLDFDLTFAEI